MRKNRRANSRHSNAASIGLILLLSILSLPGSRANESDVVINNFNGMPVQSPPQKASRITLIEGCRVKEIKTYHFNGGKGTQPGFIGLEGSDGTLVGSWNATVETIVPVGARTAVAGMWKCSPGISLPAGTYQILDSDPQTWSCNKVSSMRGFYSITLEPMEKPLQGESRHDESSPGQTAEAPLAQEPSPLQHEAPEQITDEKVSDSERTSKLYKRYVNPRFKYGIDYPGFMRADPEPDNADGLHFRSHDGQSELTVYGQSEYATVDGSAWTIAKLKEDAIANRRQDKDTITYQRAGKDWFVLSGYSGDKIYYFKAMIHGGNVKCFELKYPKSRKQEFDPIVNRIVSSFRSTM